MNLEFGTGGLRATMAEGPDHLNIQTIREATMGVAAYAKTLTETPSAAIAYDSRLHSEEFAKEAAKVLARKGCRAYIYPQLMPTPALSFAVRDLGCDLGICITASHNPKDYNGYKVYGADGCQITSEAAKAIQEAIAAAGEFTPEMEAELEGFETYLEEGKIQYISEETGKRFLEAILSCRTREKLTSDLKVVYTPLNGAGIQCIPEILKEIGIKELQLVEEQAEPDGNFPTCPFPNPEEAGAMDLGLKLSERVDADILLASDPDSDRIGVAAKKNGVWKRLNGNQVGVLMMDYILKERCNKKTMPERPILVKTIVTSSMADKVAANYGVEVIDTLTGFKYIGEQIGLLEQKGEAKRYVFGLEESCGYLIGTYVRDKDAVGAAMVICEMADAYKAEGKTLWDKLEELYQCYGTYETDLQTYQFSGEEAAECMRKLRAALSGERKVEIEGAVVARHEDYKEGIKGLPKSNVVKLWMEDDSTMVIRPSGTEPKIKIYKEIVR